MLDDNLRTWIAALDAADTATRNNAARDIFNRGVRLIAPLLDQWTADPEFSACISFAGAVEITVGVAVGPERFDAIRAANGMPALADVPPDQDAKEFELNFSDGVRLDVLTSREPGGSGAIACYLKKFGEGIQQVEVNVTDVARATESLRARFGIEPIYPATRAGANRTRVNFFLVAVPGSGKLLVEFVQSVNSEA